MKQTRVALIALVLGWPSATVHAIQQNLRPTELDGPFEELLEPLSRITGLGDLPDGRIVMADAREHRVVIADFPTLEMAQLGRNGAGPREYRTPFAVVSLAGDTLGIYDNGNRRILLVNPDGTLGPTRRVPEELYALGGLSQPRGGDIDGTLVSEITLTRLFPDIPPMGYLVRWRPGSAEIDSLTDLLVRDADGRRVLGPFIERDGWDVARNGRLAIVRGSDYHVDLIGGGAARASGPPVAPEAIPITDGEIAAYSREQATRSSGVARVTGPTNTNARREIANLRQDWEFPDDLPPFQADQVRITPDGDEVWVPRKLAWDAPHPEVDVFDGNGNHISRIALPPATHLIGIGREYLYLARKDNDDLLWVRRYRRP